MRKNEIISIFGISYSEDELQTLCVKYLTGNNPLWEKEIYGFIQEWLSDDDQLVVSTSGSTGDPKQICLHKDMVISSARATNSFFNLKPNDAIWLCLPIKYIAAKLMVIRAFTGKLNLIYSEPQSYPNIFWKNRISFTALVQNQAATLLGSPKGIMRLKMIDKILIGGSSITSDIESKILQENINAWHSYGMTETITHIALRKIGSEKYFTPLEGVTIQTNEYDQLIIDFPERGVVNMVTNDLAHINSDNTFRIIGRVDNVIVTGGIKVFPEIIEEALFSIIDAPFFVTGITDNILGNKVALIIEGKNHGITIDKLIDALKDSASKYAVPREIISLEKFLYTESSKIDRKRTKDLIT